GALCRAAGTLPTPARRVSSRVVSLWRVRRKRCPAHGRLPRAARVRVLAGRACPAPSSGWFRRARQALQRTPAGSAARGGADRALRACRLPQAGQRHPAPTGTPAHRAVRRSVRPLSAASVASWLPFRRDAPSSRKLVKPRLTIEVVDRSRLISV